MRRLGGLALILTLGGFLALLVWNPHPRTARSFDRQTNGLWLGHKWYSGRNVRTGAPVTSEELEDLVDILSRQGIRYAFVHAGPIRPDGGLDDVAGRMLERLTAAAPEVVFLAWLGARVERIPLSDPAWRRSVISSIRRLQAEGFSGIHFDLEPLRDAHTGYLDLLREVSNAFEDDFLISQATPRAGPFGLSIGPLRRSFWSAPFYRASMELSDQTVLMAYDTRLTFVRAYVEFVRHQTRLLADWACALPDHELLIGIPAHEDVPTYSDPKIENLRTAAQGVRSALEAASEPAPCFRGVAVYANWVTDPEEWEEYRSHWVTPATP